jgi:eukaryotic-like serine/threonine-protein kinase
MPNCPECESPVSDGEAFCPMCGIALARLVAPLVEISAPSTPEDDPFDGTIMMEPEELARLAASSKKEVAVTETSVDDVKPQTAVPSPQDDVFRVGDFEKNAGGSDVPPTLEPVSFEDPKLPSFLDEIKDTSGNVDVRSTAEYRSEKAKTLETKQPEEPAADGENRTLVPDMPPVPSILESGNEPVATPSEDEPVPEIAKPDFDLPEYQADAPIYDSVRIVATDISESQDFVSTRIPGSRDLPRPETIQPGRSPSGNVRPNTMQNLGTGTSDGRKSSKLKPLSEGAVLNNRYEIIRKIGGGGMGAVYLASDNNLGGVLRAVKEMVQAHIEDDQQEKSINDFKRESMILSSLDHPSIPTIFDYFYDETEGRFYLVMKYISGGDLSARLRAAPEGKIDELTVTEWALQIIDVLNYLHSQPSTIVYRDLKPSNIMIDGNSGRVMLIDFGIARSISQKEEKGVTAVGTMGYAPPELFSGNVEPRSDIYSLGSTMFHLLTGADPQSNPLLIFDFQKNPRPRQINPRLTDQIERILMKSVEYNADARFASAGDMQQVLEQHLANLRAGNVTYGVGEAPAAVALHDQIVFCGFCGQRIVATDMFCAFCGSRQPIAQQGVQLPQPASKANVTAKLLIEGTAELPMPAFSLQKEENLLGRRDPMSNIFPEVDLSKFDPQTKISRRHARIWKQGGTFLVEDLGSSNGTILAATNASAVRLTPHKPQLLNNGDKIRLGDTTLHFVID